MDLLSRNNNSNNKKRLNIDWQENVKCKLQNIDNVNKSIMNTPSMHNSQFVTGITLKDNWVINRSKKWKKGMTR